MKAGVIFDLDETLIDTTAALNELQQQEWHDAESCLSKFRLYNGMKEVLSFLLDHRISIAVVSTSPSQYCRIILDHFGIAVNCIIGKDKDEKKPSPAPMIDAICQMGTDRQTTLSFGDKAKDIMSARAVGIPAVGCTWGVKDETELLAAMPDLIIKDPIQIIEVVKARFAL
jgi:HAD superfamily hydrolase (TIGR01549 family)